MAGRARDIITRFLGDEKDLVRSQKTVQGELGKTDRVVESTGARFSKVGSLIKAGFAAAAATAIGDVIGRLDQLGQKMQATEAMAGVVFGDMIDQARQWADEQNEAFGIGESALLSLLAKTQDLLVPMGLTREAAFDMSQEILTTANALSEWEGGTISATDAQMRITKAMLGEREGLVELGVKLSDAEVKSRLAAKGLDGLTGAALQQATAQVTLEAIIDKSTDALTRYEDRTGSATAKQKALEATTADTAETWAEILRPVIDEGKEAMADAADIADFLLNKLRDLQAGSEDAAEGGEGLVDVWKAATPAGAALLWILDKIAAATRENTIVQDASGDSWGRTGLLARAMAGQLDPVIAKGHEAAAAIREIATAQKEALSPTFALLQAQDRNKGANEALTGAQADYAAAVKKHGENSDQAKEALEAVDTAGQNVATSWLELQIASELLGATINRTLVKELENVLRLAGLADDVIARLLRRTVTGAGVPLAEIRDPNQAHQGPAIDTQGEFIPRSAVPAPRPVVNNYNTFNVRDGVDAQQRLLRQTQKDLERMAREVV